jgi:hypothetical protein
LTIGGDDIGFRSRAGLRVGPALRLTVQEPLHAQRR